MPFCQVISRRRQILDDVHAGRKEIWQEHHLCSASGDAQIAAGRDSGLTEFEIRRHNNRIFAAYAEKLGQMLQVRVRFRSAAPVRDQ